MNKEANKGIGDSSILSAFHKENICPKGYIFIY